jgi:hypothetical protein
MELGAILPRRNSPMGTPQAELIKKTAFLNQFPDSSLDPRACQFWMKFWHSKIGRSNIGRF